VEKSLFEGLKCSRVPLHVASLLGYEEIVRYLIEKEANPNIMGDGWYNALHFCILGRKAEIA
jgi:ankyrin repeat protein